MIGAIVSTQGTDSYVSTKLHQTCSCIKLTPKYGVYLGNMMKALSGFDCGDRRLPWLGF